MSCIFFTIKTWQTETFLQFASNEESFFSTWNVKMFKTDPESAEVLQLSQTEKLVFIQEKRIVSS